MKKKTYLGRLRLGSRHVVSGAPYTAATANLPSCRCVSCRRSAGCVRAVGDVASASESASDFSPCSCDLMKSLDLTWSHGNGDFSPFPCDLLTNIYLHTTATKGSRRLRHVSSQVCFFISFHLLTFSHSYSTRYHPG